MTITETPRAPFPPESFVVAAFARGAYDEYARVLENQRLLAFYALGTRGGTRRFAGAHSA